MTDRERAEEGSFHWYVFIAGDFVKTVACAIQRADPINLQRLRLAFPQMVAAFESSSWDTAPAGFAPRYDAPRLEAGNESQQPERTIVLPGNIYGPVGSEFVGFLRMACGEAKLPDGTVLEISTNVAGGAPLVYCPKTERYYALGWREILDMAIEAGILSDAPLAARVVTAATGEGRKDE